MTKRWPASQVETRKLADLVPYARNSRTHSEAQVSQIAASMREWGWTNPILVDEAGGVIAGHGRLLAAQKLGFTEAPCMTAVGWTDAQKRAYVIADNKLALNAGWDEEMLAVEMSALVEDGFDLALTGFMDDELAALLADKTEGETDPDDVPDAPAQPCSELGDVWILGKHRLICGDSTSADDVAAVFAGVQPHLMVTDPPYGVEYDPSWRNVLGTNSNKKKQGKVANDDRADWSEAWALFPGDVAYVWHGALHAGTVADSLLACDFEIRSQIIWAKERHVFSRGHYHWQHEPCWYAVRGKGHWSGDRTQSTLWSIPSRDQDAATIHGTQKPVECMRRPMLNNSSPGQAVYEPFSGSGTSLIAAETCGRACYAVELDAGYVDVAVKRWQAFTGEHARLGPDGPAFDAVALEREGIAA